MTFPKVIIIYKDIICTIQKNSPRIYIELRTRATLIYARAVQSNLQTNTRTSSCLQGESVIESFTCHILKAASSHRIGIASHLSSSLWNTLAHIIIIRRMTIRLLKPLALAISKSTNNSIIFKLNEHWKVFAAWEEKAEGRWQNEIGYFFMTCMKAIFRFR